MHTRTIIGTTLLGVCLASLAGGFATRPAVPPNDLLKEPDGLEMRFSHFPSLNRLRVMLLRPPPEFVKWQVLLQPVGKQTILARAEGSLPFARAGRTLETPALEEGSYEVRLTLLAAHGGRRELRRTFERQRFAWENNRLGQDRVVIPPFTPLVVEESPPRIDCVLRSHLLSGAGLWSQVTSRDRALLAAPMRLEVDTAEGVKQAAGEGVRLTEKSPDRVRGAASWTAGAIRGRTELDFEYDGMMKAVVHFGQAGQRLQGLRLVIPMRTEEASLMHPVTDLLRFHFAGRIPAGKGRVWDYGGISREVLYTETGTPDATGKVWDSRHVGRWQLPGPFVPYLWVGGPERGIAWFAENDRDWSLSAGQPALEIRRQGPVTSLVIHLIRQPVVLARPRTIVFGLMATPAKPMPAAPVSHRRWWTGLPGEGSKDVVGFSLMGACYYWGATGPCYDFWPAGKRFTIYDELARLRRGGAVNPAFTEQWLAQLTAPDLQSHLKTYRAHVDWSIRFFARQRWDPPAGARQTTLAIPYLNARSMPRGEEVGTFMDEWSTLDVADPRWPGEERFVRTRDNDSRLVSYGKVLTLNDTVGVAYATDPVSSWQDMVLHYQQRMLKSFADGVYYDDYFLVPNYNPLGPGYVDDQGNLRPGVNIFAFRELTRRTAVMQHRMGRRPLVFLHMTNTNIVPILSFGTILLDHEWRDQGNWRTKTCQERLSLDEDTGLLLAQSTGLQSGCLSVLHNLYHPDERLVRSALGVALIHEMRMDVNGGGLFARVGKILCDFGYGLPDCRVWRYWDDQPPLTARGVPVKTLVLARPGEALVVVTGHGPAGEVILRLDAAALRLPAAVEVRDAENGEKLDRLGSGEYKLRLPRHDFRIIRVGKGVGGGGAPR